MMFYCCCYTTLTNYLPVPFSDLQIMISFYGRLTTLSALNCANLAWVPCLDRLWPDMQIFSFPKLSCWKLLIDSSPHVLNALQLLGSAETERVQIGLTDFVLQLYCKSRHPTSIILPPLRWHLCSMYQFESEKLPPTCASFRQKILRASYTAK